MLLTMTMSTSIFRDSSRRPNDSRIAEKMSPFAVTGVAGVPGAVNGPASSKSLYGVQDRSTS
jgi:hypothetical protein